MERLKLYSKVLISELGISFTATGHPSQHWFLHNGVIQVALSPLIPTPMMSSQRPFSRHPSAWHWNLISLYDSVIPARNAD